MTPGLSYSDVLACSSAILPWIGGLMAKSTGLLLGVLVAVALLGARRAALRHWTASVGFVALLVLPLLSLWVSRGDQGTIGPPFALPSAAASSIPGWLWIGMAIWAVVAGALLIRLLVDLVLLTWYARREATVVEPWTRRARELARRVGVGRDVRVLRTDAVDIPYTWGLLHPVILLPRTATGWTAERMDAVLFHELGHVRRNDTLFAILSRVTCALYWFHPLAWWVDRSARESAERSCDMLVVEQGITPARYARDLLEILRDARRPAVSLAPTMARESHLAHRIVALVERRPGRSRAGRLPTVAILLVVLLTTFTLAAVSVPGSADPFGDTSACFGEPLPIETEMEEAPMSTEPEQEPYTPMESF